MAKSHANIERRGGVFYYRTSFTLNGKVFPVRLSLNTGDPALARERAARMDRQIKRRWQWIAMELKVWIGVQQGPH